MLHPPETKEVEGYLGMGWMLEEWPRCKDHMSGHQIMKSICEVVVEGFGPSERQGDELRPTGCVIWTPCFSIV